MNNAFSDRATFLAALAPLSGALFTGGDLSYDAAARTMTLTLTHQGGGGTGAGLFGKKGLQTSRVTVHRIESYKQSLTGAEHEGYVLDRAEVSRGGRELAFYFRPGDRAVEALGAAASAPRRQPNVNPLKKEELERAARNRSLLGRLLGRQP